MGCPELGRRPRSKTVDKMRKPVERDDPRKGVSVQPQQEVEDISLSEHVYRHLRSDILNGLFAPGQALKLELLKQHYGSSFSPIREALNRLRSERLVISTTSRGFKVASLSVEEMWDACEARILIDCEALRRSLVNAGDAWEAQLVAAFHSLTLSAQRLAAAGEAEGWSDLQETLEARHWDFHQALIAACQSPWLLNLSGQLYAQTERYRRPVRAGKARPRTAFGPERKVDDEHRQLLEAALARDDQRAVQALTQHYRRTAEFVQEVLEQDALGLQAQRIA